MYFISFALKNMRPSYSSKNSGFLSVFYDVVASTYTHKEFFMSFLSKLGSSDKATGTQPAAAAGVSGKNESSKPCCASIRTFYSSAKAKVQQFDRVAFQQSCARAVVSFVGTGTVTTAFLGAGLKKIVEIGLQRNSSDWLWGWAPSFSLAQNTSLSSITCGIAVAPTVPAMVAIAVTDAVCQNKFAETKGWAGIAGRHGLGLAFTIGAAVVVPVVAPLLPTYAAAVVNLVSLPELLPVYAAGKAVANTVSLLDQYSKDSNVLSTNCAAARERIGRVLTPLREAGRALVALQDDKKAK